MQIPQGSVRYTLRFREPPFNTSAAILPVETIRRKDETQLAIMGLTILGVVDGIQFFTLKQFPNLFRKWNT